MTECRKDEGWMYDILVDRILDDNSVHQRENLQWNIKNTQKQKLSILYVPTVIFEV